MLLSCDHFIHLKLTKLAQFKTPSTKKVEKEHLRTIMSWLSQCRDQAAECKDDKGSPSLTTDLCVNHSSCRGTGQNMSWLSLTDPLTWAQGTGKCPPSCEEIQRREEAWQILQVDGDRQDVQSGGKHVWSPFFLTKPMSVDNLMSHHKGPLRRSFHSINQIAHS